MSIERMTYTEWCAWRNGLKVGLIYGVAIGIILWSVLGVWLD
jgi:tetrahydromethanopterin S-methyltransferase subunit G